MEKPRLNQATWRLKPEDEDCYRELTAEEHELWAREVEQEMNGTEEDPWIDPLVPNYHV